MNRRSIYQTAVLAIVLAAGTGSEAALFSRNAPEPASWTVVSEQEIYRQVAQELPAARSKLEATLEREGGVVPALGALLQDADPRLRDACVQALGELGDRAAGEADALATCLDDRSSAVRVHASFAIPQVGRAGLAATLQRYRQYSDAGLDAANTAIRRFGEEAAPACDLVLETLRHKDSYLRACAAETLSELGPKAAPALDALLEALGDESELVRTYAVRALAAMGPLAIRPLLRTATRAPAPARDGALEALTESAGLGELDGATVQDLRQAMSADDGALLVVAVQLLGQHGEAVDAALPALLHAITTGNAALRARALATSMIVHVEGSGPSLETIDEALHRPDAEVRQWGLEVLERLPRETRGVVPMLVRLLHDPQPSIRAGAAASLGWFDALGPTEFDALGNLLTDPVRDVRARAADALAGHHGGSEGSQRKLRAALSDPDKSVREAVQKALDSVASPSHEGAGDVDVDVSHCRRATSEPSNRTRFLWKILSSEQGQ